MKKSLKWNEPKAFLAIEKAKRDAAASWYKKPVIFILIAGILTSEWYADHITQTSKPLPFEVELAFVKIIAGSFLVCHFDTLVGKFISNIVAVNNKELLIMRSGSLQLFKLKDIISFSFRDEVDYRILVVLVSKGRQVQIGVPNDFDIDKIEAFLSRNVSAVPSAGENAVVE